MVHQFSQSFTGFLVIAGPLFRIAAASAWVMLATAGEPRRPLANVPWTEKQFTTVYMIKYYNYL